MFYFKKSISNFIIREEFYTSYNSGIKILKEINGKLSSYNRHISIFQHFCKYSKKYLKFEDVILPYMDFFYKLNIYTT